MLVAKHQRISFIILVGCVMTSATVGGGMIASARLSPYLFSETVHRSAPPEEISVSPPPPQTADNKAVFPRARLAEEVIDLRLTPDAWDDLCERMVMSEEQRRRADQLFQGYEEELDRVRDELALRVMPLAEVVFEEKQLAKVEGRPPSGELMQSARVQVYRELLKGTAEVWEIHERFFPTIREILAEEQHAQYDRTLRAWRRVTMSNPRVGNEGFGRDLGSNVDVFAVMEEATEDITALAPYLDSDWIGGSVEGAFAPVREQCQALLRQFEVEADAQIVSFFQWTRIAALKRHGEGQRKVYTSRYLRRWLNLHRLNIRITESMAEIIQEHRPDLADQWRDAFYAACFPGLYAPSEVDLLHEWIEQRKDEVEEDHLKLIQIAYREFTARRRIMRAQTRSCLLDAMKRRGEVPSVFAFRSELGDAEARNCYGWEKSIELEQGVIIRFLDNLEESLHPDFLAARAGINRKLFNLSGPVR